jgi:hypothetical protein
VERVIQSLPQKEAESRADGVEIKSHKLRYGKTINCGII